MNHTSNQGVSQAKRITVIVTSVFAVLVVAVFALYEWTKTSVTVEASGEEQVVRTHAGTVEELLEQLGIELEHHDQVEPEVHTDVSHDLTVRYKEAQNVTLMLGEEEERFWTTASTVGEMLEEEGFSLKEKDVLEPSVETEIEAGMNIAYHPAVQVSYTYDGKEHQEWSASATVADFLKQADVPLGEYDRVEPGLDEQIEANTTIQIVRVEKVTDVTEEAVAFNTTHQEDATLNKGEKKVIEQGEEGQLEKHYTITLEDGEEVSRELEKTETVAEAKDERVAVGTKELPTQEDVQTAPTAVETVATSQEPKKSEPVEPSEEESVEETESKDSSNGKDSMTMQATAYTAGCDGCSGVTATGINLSNNPGKRVVAVDPDVIPLGSRVHVEGYGEAIAGDTGGAITGNKIDLHVPSKGEANRFGRQSVKVTVLD
ncbi:G5 and 3D domain-containing protein [Shouchella shacheensis]|uniref:G5 and 3D domain-containing protein n=1 Tax=Shouchella shacheensis TaxID=1649580 RepID=UPI00073FFCD4|nr:G5 and 3D domain-containing protein [Shouchella shacheensis]